ncbi:hypothetical protein HN51_028355 [Arachis hypogaea]
MIGFEEFGNCSSNCDDCLIICITNPQFYYYSQPLPPPPIPPLPLDDTSDHGKSHVLSPYLVLALSVIGAAFFVVICCAIFARIFRRRRISLSPSLSLQTQDNTREDFFIDEEHGPVVNHPIWYIRTPYRALLAAILLFHPYTLSTRLIVLYVASAFVLLVP